MSDFPTIPVSRREFSKRRIRVSSVTHPSPALGDISTSSPPPIRSAIFKSMIGMSVSPPLTHPPASARGLSGADYAALELPVSVAHQNLTDLSQAAGASEAKTTGPVPALAGFLGALPGRLPPSDPSRLPSEPLLWIHRGPLSFVDMAGELGRLGSSFSAVTFGSELTFYLSFLSTTVLCCYVVAFDVRFNIMDNLFGRFFFGSGCYCNGVASMLIESGSRTVLLSGAMGEISFAPSTVWGLYCLRLKLCGLRILIPCW
ncbi:hypothetical protein Nepgr_020375 [Nepenthes gracilis]|uniref:Uncharacterized protein n=1 Tax=Nepenthes gracilis TaxID=150966 RepID=A0AAD3SWV0_NEPGR|nr:hypothetical protein Nepgr_020375 [Nepenthes gracilis]